MKMKRVWENLGRYIIRAVCDRVDCISFLPVCERY